MRPGAFESRLLDRASAVGVPLSEAQAARLAVYAELLARWNERINLTALPLSGWPDLALDRLFLEPLAAAPLAAGLAGSWVDIGSGGGSPAVPFAVATDGLQLTMTESRGKKAAFLREVVRSLELRGVQVLGRFEDLRAWPPGSVVLITCRAVTPEDTAPVATHLLAPTGRMLYFGSAPLAGVGTLTLLHSTQLALLDATVSVLGTA